MPCLLWTGPKGPGRNNLVLRISRDNGATFPTERMIATEAAGYSDLTVLSDGTVGVLWQRAGCQYLTFARLDRAFVEEAAAAPGGSGL